MRKKIRPIFSLVLLFVALVAIIYYLATHHNLLKQLGHTSLLVSLSVFALYCVMFGVLILIFMASIRLCSRKLKPVENAELNAHSMLINFFVPGQGGSVYRGLYLYKRHNLKIKNYVLATLIYYFMYAVVNTVLMLSGIREWWAVILAVLAVSGISLLVISKYAKRKQFSRQDLALSPLNLGLLLLATVLQATVQMAIFWIELHSSNSNISLLQTMIYTGAADLTLFVALTPGGIGIRESFLLFTRHLHHISSANIIVASVIDRAIFIVFLIVLLVSTVGLNIKGRLSFKAFLKSTKQTVSPKSVEAISNVKN